MKVRIVVCGKSRGTGICIANANGVDAGRKGGEAAIDEATDEMGGIKPPVAKRLSRALTEITDNSKM